MTAPRSLPGSEPQFARLVNSRTVWQAYFFTRPDYWMKPGWQNMALCAIVCSLRTWCADLQNQMAGSVCPAAAHRQHQFEGGDRARQPRPDRRGSRRRSYQATGRTRRPGPLWRPPHASRLSGGQPCRVPLSVRQKRARQHRPRRAADAARNRGGMARGGRAKYRPRHGARDFAGGGQ